MTDKTTRLYLPAVMSALLLGTAPAYANSSSEPVWDFGFHGYVNAHAVFADCDDSGAVVAGNALLCTGEDATSVSNGYSPASFQFSASTQREGFDIKAVIAIEPGTTDNSAFNGNGDNRAYRAFFTVGNAELGTIKVGRDYGVFGIDVVLEDMALGGVGAPASIRSPLNTTLGAAGYGYVFADRLSQITYSRQFGEQWQADIGIFQPLDPVSFGGNGYVGDSGSERPGIHGRLRYNYEQGFVSSTFYNQDVSTPSGSYSARGIDITAALQLGDTRFMASAFDGQGFGYYGLLIDAADSNGAPRDSSGWLAQATHTIGATKFGINYGVSQVDLAGVDTLAQVEQQSKASIGVWHTLWSMFTISGEVSRMDAESHAGDSIENTAISVGLALSF
ncbi:MULTISPECIES: porin [Idiomarina]|uniref:porin n=1 Tax=Idiomarinaceae TaxID=267893 RepID=UPI00129B106F|nr:MULTISPECIES: porin [Idiomarina]MRJ41306.1 porin [Idiomarina sp. FeN1]NCU56471.1 porin [Idiomarina sp. FenA--70]NCU59490.1 porin [Idiomarina sp. FenBw--71]UUN12659.1 porin [Idiomarina loihiensis]